LELRQEEFPRRISLTGLIQRDMIALNAKKSKRIHLIYKKHTMGIFKAYDCHGSAVPMSIENGIGDIQKILRVRALGGGGRARQVHEKGFHGRVRGAPCLVCT
jgi:hypothetical protein